MDNPLRKILDKTSHVTHEKNNSRTLFLTFQMVVIRKNIAPK